MTIQEALVCVPLFRRLGESWLAVLESIASVKACMPKDVLIRQGETCSAIYIVLSGELLSSTSTGPPESHQLRLAAGDYFPEWTVLDPAPCASTVRTTVHSSVVTITHARLIGAMRADPELAIAIARESARVSRGAPTTADAAEISRLRAQMMMYADDLKEVYDDERNRAGELRESLLDTIRVLINSIESRDHRQIGHGGRVARYAQILARQIGWSEDLAVQAAIGGLMHDLGNVNLREELIRKTGPLSREEITEMRQHPELGARIIRGIRTLEPLLPYVLYHQENFDGSGYPERRRGADIPVEARLVAVADRYDEIRSQRSADDSFAQEDALQTLRRMSRNHLDPEMENAFVDACRAGQLNS